MNEAEKINKISNWVEANELAEAVCADKEKDLFLHLLPTGTFSQKDAPSFSRRNYFTSHLGMLEDFVCFISKPFSKKGPLRSESNWIMATVYSRYVIPWLNIHKPIFLMIPK